MKVCLFNGSPRGLKSNSSHLIEWISQGLENPSDVMYLNKEKLHESYIDEIETSDIVFITFPLYVDAMPGVVMSFLETLAKHKDVITNKNVYFLIHSGFPEAVHSYPVKRYLTNYCKKVDINLLDVLHIVTTIRYIYCPRPDHSRR